MKAGNVAGLMEMPDVDGGLVGGASIDPDEFVAPSGTVCTPLRSSDPITNNRTREKLWPSY